MSNLSTNISPRRRSQVASTATPIAGADAPTRDSSASARVLIRLPAMSATKSSALRSAAKSIIEQAATQSASGANIATAAKAGKLPTAGNVAKFHANSPAADGGAMADASDSPWYARLNTPAMQKYLPYITAGVILTCMFVWMRTHTGKSKPVVADPDIRTWNTGSALPNQHVGGPAPSGPSNGSTWPGSKVPPPVTPSAPANSPSAWQVPPSGPVLPGEQVPPMPARNPAIGSPNPSDPNVVQNSLAGTEVRTAAKTDPSTIPPGSAASGGPAGVAQFQGGIAPPQQ